MVRGILLLQPIHANGLEEDDEEEDEDVCGQKEEGEVAAITWGKVVWAVRC